MPSRTENDSCLSDPNFAVICSFLQHYASTLNIMHPTFKELQEMFESKNDVAEALVDTIVKLLRKCDYKCDKNIWERKLAKFCDTYSTNDADQITSLGFRNTKTSVKLRAMKELLELQFDHNTGFKKVVNEMTPDRQRCKPMMEDGRGHLFWTMTDASDDAMVYEENLKKRSWSVLAHDRDELSNIVRGSTPEQPPRRMSLRTPVYEIFERKVKAKDLLKGFRESIGRLD